MFKNFINTLRRYTTASVLNILGLSIAFAAFIIIMMQVQYEWGFDKFHPKADRIYKVDLIRSGGSNIPTVPRAFVELVCPSNSKIEKYALFEPSWNKTYMTVDHNGSKAGFLEEIVSVYPDFVDVFDYEIIEGVGKLSDDKQIVIPQSIARKFFGNESAVGKTLAVTAERTLEVIGVYKDLPQNSQLKNWILAKFPENRSKASDGAYSWGQWNYFLYIQLAAGADPREVEKEIDKLVKETNVEDVAGVKLILLSDLYFDTRDIEFSYMITRGSSSSTDIMFAIAFLILIIAGINFVNFSTSLAPLRMKSINIQKVLGSINSKLRFALVMEAVGLCLLSFGLGVLIVYMVGESSFRNMTMSVITLSSNGLLLLCTGVIAVVLGVLAGIYPAFYTTKFQPVMALKGSFGMSPSGRMLRMALIGFQYIISFALIIAAISMQLQNKYLRNADAGFDKENIAVVELRGALAGNSTLAQNLMKNPVIEDVAYAQFDILSSNRSQGWNFEHKGAEIEPRTLLVTYNFIKLMGLKMVDGDYPQEGDASLDAPRYVFNQTAAKYYDIKVGDEFEWGEENAKTIGIVNDFNFQSMHSPISPMMFVIMPSQRVSVAHIKIKGNPYETADYILKTLAEIDPAFPASIEFYDQAFNELYKKEIKTMSQITIFSIVAVIISLMGVFGLVLFETQYRRKEIGLRKINGATVGSILVMFNKKMAVIVGVCFLVAAPLAWYGVNAWLKNFAYRTPIHWWVFAIALAIVLLVTVVTVTAQSWRAAVQNPINSIKTD